MRLGQGLCLSCSPSRGGPEGKGSKEFPGRGSPADKKVRPGGVSTRPDCCGEECTRARGRTEPLEDRQRKASPKLRAGEVEVSEALAPKSMASLDSRSKPSPLWSQEATKDLLAPSLLPSLSGAAASQEADTWAPGAAGYYCYFAEEFLFVRG